MQPINIVKIGGNVIDNPDQLNQFLMDFAALRGPKVLVHGGGKLATEMAAKLGVKSQLLEGRRITDAATLEVVTMVYAGLINKGIVAKLQAHSCNAIGLSGADGNLIKARKRPSTPIDYGFVGDIEEHSVDLQGLNSLLELGLVPVFSAITHEGTGQLLNTNADTIASVLAVALAKDYRSSLVYCFEKKGVLREVDKEDSLIEEITSLQYPELVEQGILSDGMIPKLSNAFSAIEKGVESVRIGASSEFSKYGKEAFGTTLLK